MHNISRWVTAINDWCMVFAGVKNFQGIFLALFFGEKIHQFKGSLCGALSGIFLYLSLASLFPVLHSLMSEQVTFDQETKKFHKKTKKQYCLRLILANIAFFIAIGMLVYLVQTGPNLLHLKGVDDFYKSSKEKFTHFGRSLKWEPSTHLSLPTYL